MEYVYKRVCNISFIWSCNGQKNENLPTLISRKIRKRKILGITDYSLIVLGTKCYLSNYRKLHDLRLQIIFNNFTRVIINIICNKSYIVYIIIIIIRFQIGTYKTRCSTGINCGIFILYIHYLSMTTNRKTKLILL
jgi:hypothetical protein